MIEAFNSMAAELASSRRRLERTTWISNARTARSKVVAAISRPSSSASPRASSRSIPPAASARSIQRRCACSTSIKRRHRTTGGGRVRPTRPAADQRRARSGGPREERRRSRRKSPSCATGASSRGRCRHPADRRGRDLRGSRARARRCHAADPRAEGCGMARSRSPAGARDQEPAHADSIVGRADAAQALRRSTRRATSSCRSARRRSSARSKSLKNLVDEFSQFARMPPPRAVPTDLHQLVDDALALYEGLFTDVAFERRFSNTLPQVRIDPEQTAPRGDQPDRQRHRGHRPQRAPSRSRPSHDPGNSLVRIWFCRTTALEFLRVSAKSCSCRITRPRGGAAGSGWRSCGVSSPSTAAASTSQTTCRTARALRLNYRPDHVIHPDR